MGIEVDGANQKLILDSDGDTYIEGATDDTLKVYVSGAEDLRIGANAINVLSGTTLTIDSGATITNSGTANGFGALAGIDDQTSSNDDQLTITDTAVVINEDSDDLDFRVESNGNANMLFVSGGNDVVGVGAEGDLGAGLHIKTADSSASVSSDADELVIEGSGNSGMSILSGTSNSGNIFFGDSGDNDVGFITYEHNNERMIFGAGANHTLQVGASEVVVNNDSDDVDFRVESNGNTHALFVDAGNDVVRIGGSDSYGSEVLYVQRVSSSHNSSITSICVDAETSGTAADGVGTDIIFIGSKTGQNQVALGHIGFINADVDGAFGDFVVKCRPNGTMAERFRIASNGDLTATDTSISSNSDSRLKENISDFTYDLTKFKELKPKTFDWKNPVEHGGKSGQRGFIAQELEATDSYWVDKQLLSQYESADIDGNKVDGYTSDYDLIGGDHMAYTAKLGKKDAMYVSVIKQLLTKIETLETKVTALENA